MIETLHFIRGAVSTTDKVLPVLTHFCIYKAPGDGPRIQGANGRINIDAPTNLEFECIVPAEKFLRAVDSCNVPEMKLTDKGRLVVQEPGFRAVLPTQPVNAFPKAEPSRGQRRKLDAGLLDVLRKLRPFIATDAERAWASTVFFDCEDKVAFAASNAMIGMVECDPFHSNMQVPIFCIDELLRIGADPHQWCIDETSITFFWKDAWLRSSLIAAEWPTTTAKKWLGMKAPMKKLPEDMVAEVEKLVPFCPDPKYPVIRFEGQFMKTLAGDSEASVDVGQTYGSGAFHADNLRPMLAASKKMVITEHAALFEGDGFRGVMSLLRI